MKNLTGAFKLIGAGLIGALFAGVIAYAATGFVIFGAGGGSATVTNGKLDVNATLGGGGTQNVNLFQVNSVALASATAGFVPVEINPAQGLAVTGSVSIVGPMVSTIADCADVTKGCLADAKSTATDTTPISLVSINKQQSASLQAIATSVAGATPAGTNLIGGVNALTATTGGATNYTALVPGNTTGVLISAGQHTVYGLDGFTDFTQVLYVKLYNKATAPTCGTDTPVWHGIIPALASGAGFAKSMDVGRDFSLGVGICVTAGYADADTTSPTTGHAYVDVGYK